MPLKVLVAGGGVAALETLIGLHHLAGDRVLPLLLAPDREFVYRPLSTGDPFALGATRRHDLDELLGRIGAERLPEALESVDPDRRTVRTADGRTLEYDALVVALGAVQVPVYADALTFTGPGEAEAVHGVVQDVEAGYVRRLAFVVPPGVTWPLPAYELALQAAERAYGSALEVEVTLVTPEPRALASFGPEAGAAIASLLAEAGVRLVCATEADVPARGRVRLGDDGWVDADRVVALPRLEGPRVPGLPADRDGFIPIDRHARVVGVPGVFAAGDVTAFPIKQGGIATQQADAAVEVIAAEAGADVTPEPFRPVLRGMLLTGQRPQYLRYEGDSGETATSERALWWPPGKIAGRWLTPFLGEPGAPPPEDGMALELALEPPAST